MKGSRMAKEKIIIQLGRPKTRAHRVLFGDTPFKPRVVDSKLQYKRRSKHRKRDQDLDS